MISHDDDAIAPAASVIGWRQWFPGFRLTIPVSAHHGPNVRHGAVVWPEADRPHIRRAVNLADATICGNEHAISFGDITGQFLERNQVRSRLCVDVLESAVPTRRQWAWA